MQRLKDQLSFWGRAALAVLGFACLATALFVGATGHVPEGTMCGTLGLVILAFVYLSRFKTFKGLGFEAEMWEEKQQEASALIEQTKALLGVLTSAFMTVAPRLGRFDSAFSRQELHTLAVQLETLMRGAGIPSGATEIHTEMRRIFAGDLAREIARAIDARIEKRRNDAEQEVMTRTPSRAMTPEEGEEIVSIRQKAVRPDYTLIAASPPTELVEMLRGWIASSEILTPADRSDLLSDHAEQLADLEAWSKDGTIRRPNIFFGSATDG